MKTLERKDIPADFTYYRTASRIFYEYSMRYVREKIIKIGEKYGFAMASCFFPWLWSVHIEKHDEEITRETLRKYNISHGIMYWAPLRRGTKPKGWYRLPIWITRRILHSSRSAFSHLDRADYWNKWTPKARAHRRHVLDTLASGEIRIEETRDIEKFLTYYRQTKITDPNKFFVLRMTRKLFPEDASDYRIFIAYQGDRPLAGAVFIDEWVTSEYWASFYHRDGYPYHLGIAIMDRWFLDSYKKWIKYCDLDHMRDSWQSLGYRGYTKFKESIADYDVYFHDMWVKIF